MVGINDVRIGYGGREGKRLNVLRYEVPDRLTVIKAISNVFRDKEGQGCGRGLEGSGMLD